MAAKVISKDANNNDATSGLDGSVSSDGSVFGYRALVGGTYEAFVNRPGQGGVTLLSQSGSGPANSSVRGVVLSGNGNAVVFDSGATNLSTLATNGTEQVYRVDVATGLLQLVSQSTVAGVPRAGQTNNYGAVTSEDGRYVAFTTSGVNGVANLAGSTQPVSQAVVKDYGTGQINRVSTSTGGVLGNANSTVDSIANDAAARVAFETASTNLGFANNGNVEVYVKDLVTGGLVLASAKGDGTVASNAANTATSGNASLSSNGQVVAFQSNATNLDPGATGGNSEIYVKDLSQGGTLKLVSTSLLGGAADGNSTAPIISGDGKYVEFTSTATNLVKGVNDGSSQVYVYSFATNQVSLLSGTTASTAGNGTSTSGETNRFTGLTGASGSAFTADDKTAVFTSLAPSLTTDPAGVAEVLAAPTTVPDTTPPVVGATTVSVANGTVTNNPSVTLTTTATDDVMVAGVAFFEGTTQVGTGVLGADGKTYTANVNLPAGVETNFYAKATDAAGNVGTGATNTVSFTVDQTAPTVAFDTSAKFKDRQTAVLTGTYGDNLGTTQPITINVYESGKLLGAATVANGTWSLTHKFSAGDHGFFTAVATDQAGNSATGSANYGLSTGDPSGTFKAEVDAYDSEGNYLGYTKYNNDGSVNEVLKASTLKNGQYKNNYTSGSAVRAKGVSSYVDILKTNGDLVSETQNVLKAGGQNLDGSQGSTTFVFPRQFGSDTIAGFFAEGSNHDTLSLPNSEFSSFAQVLQNASQQGADTVIKAPDGTSLTLKNIAVASLTTSDFKFHA